MRRLFLASTLLLLAGCNDRGQWENQQAELANEASPPAAQANDVTAAAPAGNDVNAAAGNDVNAATTDMNDVNSAAPANEAAPKG
jgi:hypothetical protein